MNTANVQLFKFYKNYAVINRYIALSIDLKKAKGEFMTCLLFLLICFALVGRKFNIIMS